MTLASKKYQKFYKTDGTGADKVTSEKLNAAALGWAAETAKGCADYMADPIFAPIIYQMQQMQDELDALRDEISANKSKSTFPGFGTSSTTALRGDTTTISTSQASAITANTAKVSQGLSTANMTMSFDVANNKGAYELRILITDSSGGGKPVIKSARITLS